MTIYSMGTGILNKPFCKTCGLGVTNRPADLSPEQIDALPERRRQWWQKSKAIASVNLRLLDTFDYKSLETRKFDGYRLIPTPYLNP